MRNIPTITKNLLIINVLAFIAMSVLKPAAGLDLNDICGLHFFMASDFHVYQLVTYMFMHGGFEHILFNMFALWMFGCVVERVWDLKNSFFITFSAVSVPDFYRRWLSSFRCIWTLTHRLR